MFGYATFAQVTFAQAPVYGDQGGGEEETAEPDLHPVVEPTGAGAPPGKPHKQPQRGPYAPAFARSRSVSELYRQIPLPEKVEPEAVVEPEPPKEKPKLGVSPLPMVADLGSGPIMLGISLSEQMKNELLADDEDALIAILLAVD